jgi:type II secretory pathway pseudopilin PulG
VEGIRGYREVLACAWAGGKVSRWESESRRKLATRFNIIEIKTTQVSLSHFPMHPLSRCPTFSPAHLPTSCGAGENWFHGFTILELVVVLVCICFFAMMIASRLGTISEGAGVTTAHEEMNNIKKAINDMFYPDLGVIPEDAGEDGKLASDACPTCSKDDRPWYATRYLCLQNDGKGNPQYEDMLAFLTSYIGNKDMARGMLAWDRYKQKGWRGPYMEQDAMARLGPAGEYYFPFVATPWAEKCEKLALEAEESGDDQEAETLRRGKYYLIVVDRDEDNNFNPIKNTARVVCFGADCEDDGSYYKDYDTNNPTIRATANDLRKPNIYDSNNPDNLDYYNTKDDIVVFIFGGGVMRKPGD